MRTETFHKSADRNRSDFVAKIRIGIIGTGGMANAHAEHYKKIAGVQLVSCLDVIPGKAAEFATKHGMTHVATDVKDLLGHVDAVSIVTPDRFHAEPSLEVLRAGKHLLCEKPLTVTLAEAKKVAAAAKKAASKGAIHMVNFSYRKSSAIYKAAELIRTGKIGKLRHVSSSYLQSWLVGMWGGWEGMGAWRLQTSAGSGGALADIGCHILDLTTAITGEPTRIRATMTALPKITKKGAEVTKYEGVPLDANDSAIIELEFPGGAIGVVQATRWATGHGNHLRFEAHGTHGAIRLDLDKSYDELETCLGDDRLEGKWTTLTLKPTPSNWERFIKAIKTGKQDQPDVFRGAQVQSYLDGAFKSVASGKWEKIAKL